MMGKEGRKGKRKAKRKGPMGSRLPKEILGKGLQRNDLLKKYSFVCSRVLM